MATSTKDQERARWTAELAIALHDKLTSADMLMLLNAAYDVARSHGVGDGIERALDGMKLPTIPRQAI